MNSFIVALNVVLPLVVLIGIGYYAKESKIVSKESFKQINQIAFKLFIPASLMKNIMETDLSISFQPKLILYACLSLIILCIVLWIVVNRFEKDKKKAGVIIQAISRSNFVLFGLAIASNMYGSDNVAVTSVLISFCVPLINVLAVIILQYHGMDQVDLKSTLISVIKNPMLIGTFFGFAILLLDIQLPIFLKNSINDIAKIATPLALIVLGGTFEIQAVSKNLKILIATVFTRLIVVPAVFVGIAILLGYRNVELISLLVLFGSPTAVASYAMAVNMNCDGELASQAVLMTTIFSIFSMILWISCLTSMGML